MACCLNLSDASVSRVNEAQAIYLHVSNGDRECGVDTFCFEFAHVLNQLTTGFNTFSKTVQLKRDLNYYRLLLINCEEVNMQRLAIDRVESGL